MSPVQGQSLPTDRVPSTNAGSSTPADGSITAAQLADGVVPNAVRRGVLLGGASQASTNWAPSAQTFSFGVNTRIDATSATASLIGFAFTGTVSLTFFAGENVLTARIGGTRVAEVDFTAYLDKYVRLDVEVTPTSMAILVDGIEAATGTHSQVFGATATTARVGQAAAGGGFITALVWNVSITDPADDTNTAYFPLDGHFRNEHPGSTVADATVTGFVDFALVQGDGGEPVRAGRSVLLYSATRTSTSQSLSGAVSASHALSFETSLLDPTDSLDESTGIWTAPGDGEVEVSVNGAIRTSRNEVVFVELWNGGVLRDTREIYLGTASDPALMCSVFAVPVTAGDALFVQISGIAPDNSALAYINGGLVIRFTRSA